MVTPYELALLNINSPISNGNHWDFRQSTHREKIRSYVRTHKPMWIIGSPPCDQWSIMQNLNNGKCDPVMQQ